jgi:hypothetical protein
MITTIYRFSISGGDTDIPTISNSPTSTPIDLPKIPVNVSKTNLQKRFIFDIMKDGNASNIHIDDNDVYENFSTIAFDKNYIELNSNYMGNLKKIEKDMEDSIGKGIDFPGLIKKSTDKTTGTNIMKTREVFFESGANEESVCIIDPDNKAERICTPAATLDSASKGTCVRYFPTKHPLVPVKQPPQGPSQGPPQVSSQGPSQGPSQELSQGPPQQLGLTPTPLGLTPTPPPQGLTSPPQEPSQQLGELPTAPPTPPPQGQSPTPPPQIRTVIFDTLFCERFGFPSGFTWSASNIDDKEDEFIVSFGCNYIGTISENVRWGGNFKGDPFFVLGNKEKNKKINSIMNKMDSTNTPANVERSKQIFRLLLMKELGDVMQVFMYYAYVMIKKYENAAALQPSIENIKIELHKDVPIEHNAMLTVDSVVYLLCRILSLPCVYTGARAGVVSGQAFYKLYTPIAMTNDDVYNHINNSLNNMYQNILTSNDTNITHLTNIKEGLTNKRDDPTRLKWYFFFIKKSDTTASATKPQWIEETMSAFAKYKGIIEQYNVSDTIIEQIIANVNTLIKAIEASNKVLGVKKSILAQEYNAGNLSVSQASSSSSVGDPPWSNWDTSNEKDKIINQRNFINKKLEIIGSLNEYRSEEHVTELKKNSFIVNCAKTILCKGFPPDVYPNGYYVRPKNILINKDSIIDINEEVNNKLDDVVKAIRAKFGVPTSGLNINAGMHKSVPKSTKIDERSSPRNPRNPRGFNPDDAGTSDAPPLTPTTVHDAAVTTVATPPTDDASYPSNASSQSDASPSNASSQSDASPSNASSRPENMAVVDEVDETQPGESQPLGYSPPLGNSQDREDEELLPDVTDADPSHAPAAAPAAAAPPPVPPVTPSANLVSADQPMDGDTSNSSNDFLDLYNIDKNIYFLSKFLYDMIDISDVINFDPADIKSTDNSDIEEAIHNILLRKYYYSTNKDDYNELFEILTRLGEVPITTFMQVPELKNACTKYIEATEAKFTNIDKTDELYININDDMYEWPQSVSAAQLAASASASAVLPPVKGDALTKKKNKQRKKNKQSRKKGNVKNKRSRKITQHKKIKYSKRKKHDNSKQSKRKKHKDKRGIK